MWSIALLGNEIRYRVTSDSSLGGRLRPHLTLTRAKRKTDKPPKTHRLGWIQPRRIHTLGGVRIDFGNSHASESESYALLRTHAAAVRARTQRIRSANWWPLPRAGSCGRAVR